MEVYIRLILMHIVNVTKRVFYNILSGLDGMDYTIIGSVITLLADGCQNHKSNLSSKYSDH